MADAPGKETPKDMSKDVPNDALKSDPAGAGKSGPVKPPVLEGSARPVTTAKPGEKLGDKPGDKPAASRTDAPKSATPPPPRPKPAPVTEKPAGRSTWPAALGGGVLGLAAAYGLAFFGLWPAQPQQPAPADPRVAEVASAIPELQTVTSTVQAELLALNSRVGGLETTLEELPAPAAPATAELDTSAIDARIDALAARLEELAAAPQAAAPVDLTQINADLAALRTALEAVQQETAANAARLGETETQVASLADQAGAAADTGAELARLPLIFSGLESAFAAGRPYDDALAALRQAQPGAAIPPALADHAGEGLPRPDDVARRTQALVPDMLAGRPLSADGDWQAATADWFRGVIAMRPAEAADGDTPEATIARLEAALARRDFAAAQAEIESLPEPMRNAAGPVADDIAALAAAGSFLDDLRAQALAQESAE